jgi:hypothetical protein
LAYLLRFFQSVMSGYFFAIHGGTYQPMMPLFLVSPASWTVFCPSTYFFTRSGCPQFSTIVSVVPAAIPCQPTSSLTSWYFTVQPSLVSARCPMT